VLLRSGQAEQARQLAARVAVRALRNDTANGAWETIAWAELELEHPERVQAFAPGASAEATGLAGLLLALTGDPDDAAGLAQAAARSGRKLTAAGPFLGFLGSLVLGVLSPVPAEEAERHRPAGGDT
jgi:hypothetical protein